MPVLDSGLAPLVRRTLTQPSLPFSPWSYSSTCLPTGSSRYSHPLILVFAVAGLCTETRKLSLQNVLRSAPLTIFPPLYRPFSFSRTCGAFSTSSSSACRSSLSAPSISQPGGDQTLNTALLSQTGQGLCPKYAGENRDALISIFKCAISSTLQYLNKEYAKSKL